MAREGLRTLVIGKKKLSEEAFLEFETGYREAKISILNRSERMQEVITNYLESDLELLGLTGVEDKLQDDVKLTLEQLKNAGLKIWMLTGDKVETATNIAISTKLISRSQSIISIEKGLSALSLSIITKVDLKIVQSIAEAADYIDSLRSKVDHCLVIDGQSLQFMTDNFRKEFIEITTLMPAVVCCRCSPTQKVEYPLVR